ncbi:MAG: sigma-70 family RNA polymerase sigma factor [Clostridia bacterium]|nr:sigma-70 family RNA polymerase sigma factor [Clostridia bacterium]
MDRTQRKNKFNEFYESTYPKAMAYCMGKTGDFLNGEDLLTDAYYELYRMFLKEKNGCPKEPEILLFATLKKRISKYWNKHRKDLDVEIPEEKGSLGAYLSAELDLSAEDEAARMLVLDILEYVSVAPAPLRRAFTLYFYLGKNLEETAAELKVSVHTAENYLCAILREIHEEFLDEYTA